MVIGYESCHFEQCLSPIYPEGRLLRSHKKCKNMPLENLRVMSALVPIVHCSLRSELTEVSPPTPVVVCSPNMLIRVRRPAYAPNLSLTPQPLPSQHQPENIIHKKINILHSHIWKAGTFFSSASGEINNSDLVKQQRNLGHYSRRGCGVVI